jgi:hypothetical protein
MAATAVHIKSSRFLAAAFVRARSPPSWFPNCVRPQLSDSHFSYLQLPADLAKSHVTYDGQPVRLGVRHPSGAQDQISVTVRELWGLLTWGALSDERKGLSFTDTAGASSAQSF